MLDDLEHDEHEPTEAPGSAAVRALEAVVEPVLSTMGYELVLLEWSGAGRHRRLRLFVDAPEGITIDDCARLSPIVSNALDAAEAEPGASADLRRTLDGPYALEVSSPGVDRPLTKLAHFLRFCGQTATVRTLSPVPRPGHGPGGGPGSTQRTFHGRIEGVLADPDAPQDPRRGTVLLEDEDGAVHRIPLPAIRRANLVYSHAAGPAPVARGRTSLS